MFQTKHDLISVYLKKLSLNELRYNLNKNKKSYAIRYEIREKME